MRPHEARRYLCYITNKPSTKGKRSFTNSQGKKTITWNLKGLRFAQLHCVSRLPFSKKVTSHNTRSFPSRSNAERCIFWKKQGSQQKSHKKYYHLIIYSNHSEESSTQVGATSSNMLKTQLCSVRPYSKAIMSATFSPIITQGACVFPAAVRRGFGMKSG